jgi:hypothetical protein
MVLAAVLISIAVLVPLAEPQSAASQQPPSPQSAAPDTSSSPYSVDGVRRAYGLGTQPSIDIATVERDRRGYRMAIESSTATWSPCVFVSNYCWSPWPAPEYPTWHDQMLAMAGPQNYSMPYTPMSNAERLQAVASNIGFGLVIQAIASAVHDQIVKSSYDRKLKKVNKTRDEIQGELDELERVNAAARQSDSAVVK